MRTLVATAVLVAVAAAACGGAVPEAQHDPPPARTPSAAERASPLPELTAEQRSSLTRFGGEGMSEAVGDPVVPVSTAIALMERQFGWTALNASYGRVRVSFGTHLGERRDCWILAADGAGLVSSGPAPTDGQPVVREPTRHGVRVLMVDGTTGQMAGAFEAGWS